MPRFEVVEAKAYHVGQIVRSLRHGHAKALAETGFDSLEVHRQMTMLFRESSLRRVWLIDGRLAALGGVTGMLLSSGGFIWLALSQEALRYPVAIIKEARRQLAEIMTTRSEVATTLIAHDDVAIRFARFLGFHGDFNKKLPVGRGFAIAVGYHLWEHRECA